MASDGKETDSIEQLRTNRHDKFEFVLFHVS